MGKRFDGCYNVFAWINNAFWGTLCIIGGIYAIFWMQNFWVGVLAIGIGIYFFWTKSWTRKTLEVIAGKDEVETAGVPGDPASEMPAVPAAAPASDKPTAPAAAPAAGPLGVGTPAGSVSRRKTVIKNTFIAASLIFMLLGARALNLDEENLGAVMVGYGGLTLACFFVYARITVHRATEDALPALPWGQMVVAVLTAAFSPNTRHVSYTTPEGAAAAAVLAASPLAAASAQPATNAVVPPGTVTKRKLQIRNAIMFVGLVILFLGVRGIKGDPEGMFTLVLFFGAPAGAVLLLASRIRFDRAKEDELPAAPWGESVAATLKEAFAPRTQAAGADVAPAIADSFASEVPAPSAGVEHALTAADGAVKAATSRGKSAVGWFSGLTGNAKAGVVAGAIVLVFFAGFLVSKQMASSASDGSYSDSYSADNPGGTGGDYTPPTDTSSSDSAADSSGQSAVTTPAERKTLQDLLATANEDGSETELTGYWDNKAIAETGQLVFIPNEGDNPPAFVLGRDDSWSANIGGGGQPMSVFFRAVSGSNMTFGTVAYTKDGIVYVDVKPEDGDI